LHTVARKSCGAAGFCVGRIFPSFIESTATEQRLLVGCALFFCLWVRGALVFLVASGSVLLLLTSLLVTLFACCALVDCKSNQKRLMGMTACMAELSCYILLQNVYPINLGAFSNQEQVNPEPS
jgi:hypothetical protein